MNTDLYIDQSLRGCIDQLLAHGGLKPDALFALQRIKMKADRLPHIDSLTAAEVAWVAMLMAQRGILAAQGVS